MHLDIDKENSLADDVYAVIERAMNEGHGAVAATIGTVWTAMHGGYIHELLEAIRPVMSRHADDSPLFFREIPLRKEDVNG